MTEAQVALDSRSNATCQAALSLIVNLVHSSLTLDQREHELLKLAESIQQQR